MKPSTLLCMSLMRLSNWPVVLSTSSEAADNASASLTVEIEDIGGRGARAAGYRLHIVGDFGGCCGLLTDAEQICDTVKANPPGARPGVTCRRLDRDAVLQRVGAAQSRMKAPLRNSETACCNSTCVFITIGPYQATGS